MKKTDYLIAALLTGFSLLAVLWYSGHYPPALLPGTALTEVVEEPLIRYRYGLPVDSFMLETGKIRPAESLGNLLERYGVGASAINLLTIKSKGIFDVRKLRMGNPYSAFLTPDSTGSLQYLVYEHSPVDYVVFRFADSVDVWNATKDIDTLQRTFTGTIQTSLWNAMIERGSNPMLAVELSEIYAWSIDFFGLQKGDSLKVVYDELFVDSLSFGIGHIHAAAFRHMGRDFLAIPFTQDGREDYFDAEGLNLRKAFLKAPLRFSRISSGFSGSRFHPILKIYRPHHGVDYSAPAGTPVVAIGDGVVVKTGYEGAAGHMVRIKHNSVYSTAYLHLSRYGEGIKTGAYVTQGQVIGYVGSTGLSTGPHLDFRFYRNGSAIDPLKVEAPSVDPVKPENRAAFELEKQKALNLLQAQQ